MILECKEGIKEGPKGESKGSECGWGGEMAKSEMEWDWDFCMLPVP